MSAPTERPRCSPIVGVWLALGLGLCGWTITIAAAVALWRWAA